MGHIGPARVFPHQDGVDFCTQGEYPPFQYEGGGALRFAAYIPSERFPLALTWSAVFAELLSFLSDLNLFSRHRCTSAEDI